MDKTSQLQWTLVRSPALSTQMKGTPRGSSVSEEDFHLSLHDSQESDSDSLVQELKYQSELQHWISENEELVHHGDEQDDSMNEGLNEEEGKKESKVTPFKEIKIAKGRVHDVLQKKSKRGRHKDADQYADLRYDPNWKKKEQSQPIEFERDQGDWQEGLFNHPDVENSNKVLEEINNRLRSNTSRMFHGRGKDTGVNEIGEQTLLSPDNLSHGKINFVSEVCDSASSLNAKFFLNDQLSVASNRYFALHEKSTDGQKSSNNSDIPTSNGFFLQQSDQASDEISVGSGDSHRKDDANREYQDTKRRNQKQSTQQLLPKKDFIEKNKVTLGMSMPKQESYLQLHSKNKGDINQEQITSITNVSNDAPTWTVIEDQPVDVDPEDVWQHRARKLKERKNKNLQSNRGKSNKSNNVFQERFYKSQNIQGSSEKQKQLTNVIDQKPIGGNIIIAYRKPSIPEELGCAVNDSGTSYFSLNTAIHEKHIESSITNSYPAKNHKAQVKMLPQINTSEVRTHNHISMNPISAEHYPYTSSESHVNGLSNEYEHFPGKHQYGYVGYPTDAYIPSQFLQSQNMNFSTCSATSQKPLNELKSLPQNHKVGIWKKGSFHSSEHLRVESDTVLNAEYGQRHETTLTRSNSEGYLLQMEKQKQLQEKHSKVFRPKGFTNQEIKLGGLGPDYQTMKDKAEQLKQQKEYAKKVKEQNRKNFSTASKAQTKPTLEHENKPLISRHKAMEYAKKIPKPKPLMSFRLPDQKPNDEDMLAHLKGNILPQMTLLEELQLRHEKEKQAVAALRTLHIS